MISFLEGLVLKKKDKKSASISLKRRSSSYLSVNLEILNKNKKDVRKGSAEQNKLLIQLGEFNPLNINEIREQTDALEALLQKKAYNELTDIKKRIKKKEEGYVYTKEEVYELREDFTRMVYKLPEENRNEDIQNEIFFTLIKSHIFTLTEENNIFNKQFKDKVRLFQCLIDPVILGIKEKHNKFAVFQNAIRGKLKRD